MNAKAAHQLYSEVAHEAAAVVIRRYSTSFALASRLLAAPMRRHVENIYALVRIADEIVDGAGEQAGASPERIRECLDQLEQELMVAVESGYSGNLVVHAFALTAREVGIDASLTTPFFASMRRDLAAGLHSAESFAQYVHGSAEVVGQMCLRGFLLGEAIAPDRFAVLDHGACRLGAAFQKVNFLRDLEQDYRGRGRSYFPDLDPGRVSEGEKDLLLADIRSDLGVAAAAIWQLPHGCRSAVEASLLLFSELADRLERTPAGTLLGNRVSVPNHVKLKLVALALLRHRTVRWGGADARRAAA
ncbi:phytoene/squalene synthase family protein [Arthrobacter sp. 35W]|uniref:phytoene/squalene synthase family protein n=1 Tax=Arthrobacter sp. 35W TaxID=1132441 RepID=UPI00041CC596|nr:squalene/phytoene synthase family protein [Arthrobacter sp. 35W]